MHGSAIAKRIPQVTRGAFQVKAGSLFPALHRLEQEDWIEGKWQESAEGRRVRSYRAMTALRSQLSSCLRFSMRVANTIERLFGNLLRTRCKAAPLGSPERVCENGRK
jgi:PadR family transcriptional regulator, regulatory protein PadR